MSNSNLRLVKRDKAKGEIMRLITILVFAVSFFSGTLRALPFENSIQENSLLKYAWSVNCQYGEEGVLQEIIRRLKVNKGVLIEFGGYDGIRMSNTRFLAEKGWSGAFIESDSNLYAQMKKNFRKFPKIHCLKEFITPFVNDPKGVTIDHIVKKYFPRKEIDVMSIDIDGLDHLILKQLRCRPKVIIIEGGMFWHPLMQLEVPDEVAERNVQQPISIMTKIAQEKGYELICSTFNAFLIRSDYSHLFAEIEKDPAQLWWEALIHINRTAPNFYREIFQIRSQPMIREWESLDPAIPFEITKEFCDSIIGS